MESVEYDRFTSATSEIIDQEPPYTPNRQNRRIFVMFGVLSLFLLTLTLTVGIKFTQVSLQVSDLMESLDMVSNSIKVLQKVSSTNPEPITPVRGPCEEDWTYFKDKCYFVSKVRKSWEDAEKNCIQRKAHLLVVNNAEEQDYISQVIETHANFWIGLVEREEGQWTWVDGTDFSKTQHFWDDGQPDNWDVRVNGEDCGQLHARSTVTHRPWNDADCTLPYKYICEGPSRRH
ncbi:hepatic lectin-like [Salminus brasiliensis]|uniref:hepatic lectin-like n=1 Tax=Salminus brasiliensis TaxID=930266 RepID=UPI003B831288